MHVILQRHLLLVHIAFLFCTKQSAPTVSTNSLAVKDNIIPQRADPKRWSSVSQCSAAVRSRGVTALEIAAEQVCY